MQWQLANFNWEEFFRGCVSETFGLYKGEHVWVYHHQPHNEAVARHGHVHVSHKTFFNSREEEGLPEFGPAIPTDECYEGIAPFKLDPRGEQFMLRFPWYMDDPGREQWQANEPSKARSGNQTDATQSDTVGTWHCDRVFRDVMKTAKAHNFPPRNKDHWSALRHFHTVHSSSNTVPNMPFTIQAPEDERMTTESFALDGQPVKWEELWRVLAFRFPRPQIQQQLGHHQHVAERARETALPSQQSADCARSKQTRSDKAMVAKVTAATIAVHNAVTSLTNPPAALARAKKAQGRKDALSTLPQTMTCVQKGTLYFVRTTVDEGEMKVGLAVALESSTDTTVKLKWFTRTEWVRERKHIWGQTPMFLVAGDPANANKPYTSIEELADVCPVPVTFTKQCILNNTQSTKPKLSKECVQMLREWCVTNGQYEPEPKSMSNPEDAGDDEGSIGEEDGDESQEGETDSCTAQDDTSSSEHEKSDLASHADLHASDDDMLQEKSQQCEGNGLGVGSSESSVLSRVVHNRSMRVRKKIRYR